MWWAFRYSLYNRRSFFFKINLTFIRNLRGIQKTGKSHLAIQYDSWTMSFRVHTGSTRPGRGQGLSTVGKTKGEYTWFIIFNLFSLLKFRYFGALYWIHSQENTELSFSVESVPNGVRLTTNRAVPWGPHPKDVSKRDQNTGFAKAYRRCNFLTSPCIWAKLVNNCFVPISSPKRSYARRTCRLCLSTSRPSTGTTIMSWGSILCLT